ncbi:hypothetical protein GGQ86_003042 [Xanthobacter flavus]|uniref:Uncharacterized protein n=1 Tax=Xanthobacter flavus TaxID=281 RepID=A0A9W6CNS0_XANFL|nr:hypothetical protein [Xanthobacter flavus]MDR6334560.1 hypothetical protein [Xanthobacter flavus]GLI23421.1 hypothetical protein XFLAVUS301_30950 [Xanthobacter flavus]
MPNFFDQFDVAPAAPVTEPPKPNFFDRFDEPSQPAAARPGPTVASAPAPAGLDLGVGVQGAARGIGMAVGQPFDLANMGANVLLSGADWIGDKTGLGRVPFRFKMPSEMLTSLAGNAAQSAGLQVHDPEKMTPGEKAVYNANAFGTLGALTAGAMVPAAVGRAAPVVARLPQAFDSLLAGYGAAPVRTVVGEGAAGVGAGLGKTVSEELLPEDARKSSPTAAATGAITDVLGMLLGGTAGGVASNIATGLPKAALSTARGFSRASDIPIDPETGRWARNRDADQAARYVQGNASEPSTAAENIAANANDYRAMGAPLPSVGALSEDPGVAAIAAAERNRNPAPFAQRDVSLRDAAMGELESNVPLGADPRAATEFVRREVDNRVNAASGELQAAEARLAQAEQGQRDVAGRVAPFAGRQGDASASLDRSIVQGSLEPMDAERRAAFDAVPRDATVPGRPFVETAAGIRRAAEHLPENARREVLPEQWLQDFESLLRRDADGRINGVNDVTFGTINDLRPILAAEIARARKDGAPTPYLDNLERLRVEINRATNQQPEAQAAVSHFENVYAPVWGRGAGEAYGFRQDLNVDRLHRTAAAPTATAGRFLSTGAGAREKAEALSRVVGSIADPTNRAAAESAVRTYVLGDLTRTIGRDGRIHENALARWLNGPSGWGEALSQFPRVRDEVAQLLTDIRAGSATRNRMAGEVERAGAQLKRTQADVDASGLSLVLGREPTKAAAAVLDSGDPERAMREVMATVSQSPEARLAWQRAVSERLIQKVTTASPGKVTDGDFAPEYRRLAEAFRQYERALAQVYSPEQMNALRRAQKMLEPLAREAPKAMPGSVDSANSGFWRAIELGLKATFGVLKGGGITRTLKVAAGPDAHTESMPQRLVTRMMFDPELAMHLLTRNANDVGTQRWNGKLLRLIAGAEGAREGMEPSDDQGSRR